MRTGSCNRRATAGACSALTGILLLSPAPAARAAAHKAAASRTWFVKATAPAHGRGSRRAPFRTLATVEKVSRRGDRIVILPSPVAAAPLDGGIRLKPGQRLVGDGPAVAGRT